MLNKKSMYPLSTETVIVADAFSVDIDLSAIARTSVGASTSPPRSDGMLRGPGRSDKDVPISATVRPAHGSSRTPVLTCLYRPVSSNSPRKHYHNRVPLVACNVENRTLYL